MRHKLPLAFVLSVGATLLGGQAAFAQGNTAQVDTPAGGLEEVVVSARKREESLQDVPVAVTAFTAQQIADRQLTSIDDIAKFTPGFVFS